MSFFKDVADIANRGLFAQMGLPPIKTDSFTFDVRRMDADFDRVMKGCQMPEPKHGERCHTNSGGDRQCNCFLAYDFESQEDMDEQDEIDRRKLVEYWSNK